MILSSEKYRRQLSGKKSVIGLNIGTASVNAVQIVYHQKKPVILATVSEVINVKKNDSADAAIASAVQTVLSRFSIRGAEIICVFHDPQVFVRRMNFPLMPFNELGPAVRLAVKGMLPFALDEAVIDLCLINKSVYQGKERYGVLVAACPRKIITRIQDVLLSKRSPKTVSFKKSDSAGVRSPRKMKILGTKISSVIPGAIALENLVYRHSSGEETQAILVLKSTVTELAVYKNARLEFSRRLSVTGEDITKSMTGALFSDTGKTELTFQEAEAVKTQYGIPSPDDTLNIDGKITSQQVLSLIKPKLDQLATDVSRSLDYYQQELQGDKVEKIFLTGNGALLKRLDEFLSKEIGVEVRQWNPIANIESLDPSFVASDGAVHKQILAIGAALGSARGINFLSNKSVKNRTNSIASIFKMLFFLIVGVTVLVALYLNHQIAEQESRLFLQEKEFVPELKRARESLNVFQLKKQQPDWGKVLEIFTYTPSHIFLSELRLDADRLYIDGVIVEEGQDFKTLLAEFTQKLRELGLVSARLQKSQRVKDKNDQFEFEIIADIIR